MNCECIKEINDKLVEQTGDKDAYICTSFGISDNKMITVITIPVEYQEFKKDGTRKRYKTKGTIVASHCPFCGMKSA